MAPSGASMNIPNANVAPNVARPMPMAADTHNPGNQLLRKMGWTDGAGLGKNNSGMEEAVGVLIAGETQGGGSGGGKRAGGIGSSVIPPINYDSDYKASLMRAAKARYDLVNNG